MAAPSSSKPRWPRLSRPESDMLSEHPEVESKSESNESSREPSDSSLGEHVFADNPFDRSMLMLEAGSLSMFDNTDLSTMAKWNGCALSAVIINMSLLLLERTMVSPSDSSESSSSPQSSAV
jgi:hypothetical protein